MEVWLWLPARALRQQSKAQHLCYVYITMSLGLVKYLGRLHQWHLEGVATRQVGNTQLIIL